MPIKQELPIIHSQKPSFFQTIKEGMALGVGSSIGHRIVGAIMGPSPSHMPSVQNTDKKQEYEQCMKEHDDRAVCQRILEN